MKKRVIAGLFTALVLLAPCLPGCATSQATMDAVASALPTEAIIAVEKAPAQDIDSLPLVDRGAYGNDQDEPVVTMYLTVSRGADSENTNHSWAEINSHSKYDYEDQGIDPYQVEGLLQVGDETGPAQGQLGYGASSPNATVEIRGSSTSVAPLKSYKIELKQNAGQWRNQRVILLNKHIYDDLRIRNKLCYDLMAGIPGLASMRTQFVHLYVKDDTDGGETKFVDYGLYTQIEQPNKRYLKNHGLDDNGQLYKANFFEFDRYPDAILLRTDPNFNEGAFETHLQVQGSNDHAKLIRMLEEVNDFSEPTQEVFEEYFDADNYFTWLAFNILVDNTDTQSQNFMLYSPAQSSKWYFLSWDCDGSFHRYLDNKTSVDQIGHQFGLCNYWGNVLFSRVMRIPKYRAMLDAEIQTLMKILTPARIYALTELYHNAVVPYVFRMPDLQYMRLDKQAYESACDKLSEEVELNYKLYRLSLQKPMPFYGDTPACSGEKTSFKWEVSYDFGSLDITYTFELANDCRFQQVIDRKERLYIPSADVYGLKPGKYFYRVTAVNSEGRSQVMLASYHLDDVIYYGVQCFYILQDGTVSMDEGET